MGQLHLGEKRHCNPGIFLLLRATFRSNLHRGEFRSDMVRVHVLKSTSATLYGCTYPVQLYVTSETEPCAAEWTILLSRGSSPHTCALPSPFIPSVSLLVAVVEVDVGHLLRSSSALSGDIGHGLLYNEQQAIGS